MKLTTFIFIFTCIFFIGCQNCREYVNKEFRPKRHHFTITNKYLTNSRFVTIVGTGSDNKPDTFREVGYYDLLDSAEIGECLLKEHGKTDVILIRKDSSSLVFPCICDGRVIE